MLSGPTVGLLAEMVRDILTGLRAMSRVGVAVCAQPGGSTMLVRGSTCWYAVVHAGMRCYAKLILVHGANGPCETLTLFHFNVVRSQALDVGDFIVFPDVSARHQTESIALNATTNVRILRPMPKFPE